MNDLKELMIQRRSKRQYDGKALDKNVLREIVDAGLLAPTGRNLHPIDMIIVENRSMLDDLSYAKTAGSALIQNAAAAIVVVGDTSCSDTWVEDGAIMMAYMQLMAESLGVGNCWVQIRNRESQKLMNEMRMSSADYVREALHLPANFEALAILALGMSDEKRAPHTKEDLDYSHCHRESF